ncbi:MAG: hypothetical protein P8Y60_19090 [Calditrichota bacterium]
MEYINRKRPALLEFHHREFVPGAPECRFYFMLSHMEGGAR